MNLSRIMRVCNYFVTLVCAAVITSHSSLGVAAERQSVGGLLWPSEGGIEEWGFPRPSGCSAGDTYLRPWLQRLEQKAWNGNARFSNLVNANVYESANTRNYLSGDRAQVVAKLQGQIDLMEGLIKSAHKTANEYSKLVSNSRSSRQIIDSVRAMKEPTGCDGRPSASQAMLCGLAAQLVGLTDKVEKAQQYACRLGITGPTYIATVSSGAGDRGNAPDASSSRAAATAAGSANARTSGGAPGAGATDSALRVAENWQARLETSSRTPRNDAAVEASRCVEPKATNRGEGFENSCEFKVNYVYCAFRAKKGSAIEGLDCEKSRFGAASAETDGLSAANTRGADTIYWFGCKAPAVPVNKKFVAGRGINAACL